MKTQAGVQPMGVGLIGFGMAGRLFHAPLIAAAPGLRLEAVASSRADEVLVACPGVTVHPSPEALLDDPAVGLVVLATPTPTHAPLAEAALLAGRHVVVDKPFALSLEEAKPLAALAVARGLVLQVFQNRRWDSDFLSVRQAIAAGEVGEPLVLVSRIDRFRPEVRDRWREDGAPGSGLWMDIGPHMIDQALVLFGRPDTVLADLAVLRPGGKADDHASVTLQWPGRRAELHASMVTALPGARLTVHGTGGTVMKQGFDIQEAQLVAGLRPGDEGWGVEDDPVVLIDAEGLRHERPAIRGCQEQFYVRLGAALAGGGQAPNAVADMLAVQAVLDACYRSAAEGKAIRPDYPA